MQKKQIFDPKDSKSKNTLFKPSDSALSNMEKYYWQNVHQKIIQVTGRGGKGHAMAAGNYSWNRKGRW